MYIFYKGAHISVSNKKYYHRKYLSFLEKK